MKEADLTFGGWYAIEIDNHAERWKLVFKHPVQPGKTRSRMYRINQDNGATRDIDASKILMTWADYERTPDYAEKQAHLVEEDLNERVAKAMAEWAQTLLEYLTTLVAPYNKTGRSAVTMGTGIAPRVRATTSAEDFVKEFVYSHHLTIPLSALVKLGDIPLPPADAVQSAMDQREEISTHMVSQVLPILEQRAVTAANLYAQDSAGASYFPHALREYINAIQKAQIPGPHPPLVEMAKLGLYPVDPTSDPLFAYLLDLGDDDD